jgi:hypothetical protein
MGGWRKLQNEELHNSYSLPSIIRTIKSRRMRWAGHVARKGDKKNAYGILVRNLEGKRPLGKPRRRWLDNIKMDVRDWIDLAQEGTSEHDYKPSGSIKYLSDWRLLKKSSAPWSYYYYYYYYYYCCCYLALRKVF